MQDDSIIYDFQDLFDPHLFDDALNSNFDEESFLKYLEDESSTSKERSPPQKKAKEIKTTEISRAQFYRSLPKPPKISKTDPRRQLAKKFSDTYNSCDFDTIYEFLTNESTKDVMWINRWAGKELYMNYPKYLQVRGLDKVAEYWFSRCLLTPDLIMELKETKLYVRSDGYSTIRSSFIGYCTRLYDTKVSDALQNDAGIMKEKEDPKELEAYQHGEITIPASEIETDPEVVHDRVMNKFVTILLNSEPMPRRKKRTLEEHQQQLEEDPSTPFSITSEEDKKVLPRGTSITLLGSITLQLDLQQKIKIIEVAFALKK